MSTIYLDMDGVIADFFGGIAQKHGVGHWKSIRHKQDLLNSIRYTDFFYQLKPFETSRALVNHVKQIAEDNNMQWGICSTPLEGDYNNSAYWKRVWLYEHGWMPSVDQCIFTDRKPDFAWSPITGKPNILIDDKPENIMKWNQAGGIGIRYQANEDDLEEYLFPEIDDAIIRSYHNG